MVIPPYSMRDWQTWKFEFLVDSEVCIPMPPGTKVIGVDRLKPKHICLWALVPPYDPGGDDEIRTFYVMGNGQPLGDADGVPFLGTVLDDQYVWHVFGHPSEHL